MRKTLPVLLLLLLCAVFAQGQMSAWAYRTEISVTDTSAVGRSNYQVRLMFDSQTLIAANKLQSNGGDLRFTDQCLLQEYPYWIESGLNTDSTVVWVLIDTIRPNTQEKMWMVYGNATAPDGNDFAGTFPNAVRTNGGNLILTGSLTPDYFWVEAGDTVTLSVSAALVLNNARMFRVDATGHVNGDGKGNQGVTTNFTIGAGLGGGTPSAVSNSGSGGGSYGGVGGTGGLDAGDTPGVGGAAYGTAAGTDCDLGSAGGSGGTGGFSGSGGGALDVTADYVMMNGTITMGGTIGGNSGQCGGGGSGGCVKLVCHESAGTGTISVNGGNGGPGTSTANDSGGGGGGGRVKTFSASAWPAMTLTATGGPGGPYGTGGPAQPGGVGSTNSAIQAFIPGMLQISASVEEPNSAFAISAPVSTICAGDSLTLSAPAGFFQYAWSNGDSVASTTITAGGSYSVLAMVDSNSTCAFTDTLTITAYVTTTLTITGADTLCPGACDTLSATSGFVTYLWSNGSTSSSALVCGGGSYSLMVTDSNQCTVMDTLEIAEYGPVGLVVQPASACDGDTILLDATANGAAWLWSNGATTPTILVTQSGNYDVTVTTSEGCDGSGTFVVTINLTPTPVIQANGSILSTTTTFTAYQWYLNGNLMIGETQATHTAGLDGSYTVMVVDGNGCTGLSAPLIVTRTLDALPVAAFVVPNPASSEAVLWLQTDASLDVQLRLVDALGRSVWADGVSLSSGSNRVDLPLQQLAAGIYTVQIHDGSRQASLKLVKQ